MCVDSDSVCYIFTCPVLKHYCIYTSYYGQSENNVIVSPYFPLVCSTSGECGVVK